MTTTRAPKRTAKPRKPVSRQHTCATCGHIWSSLTDKDALDIIKAVVVNNQGPFCGLCRHIEMAKIYASLRGCILTVRITRKTLDLSAA